MPPRAALGDAEVKMIEQALGFYRERGIDPGYQGYFEKLYTDAFVAMMGGGFADAVATGTSALYVALAALGLPEDSEVLLSPITDPGTISAVILNRLRPRLMDAEPGRYDVGPEQFLERVTPATRAAVVVHSLGHACAVDKIAEAAHARGILVVEDCSQSHAARIRGRPVGTFGDIAAFSTMYRKAHITGGAGGIVYSRDLELFRRALAHADRGKPRWRPEFDDRNPTTFLFPALNHHSDEISCAVGLASLARLSDTIIRRLAFVAEVSSRLLDSSAEACRPYGYSPSDSPFVYPIVVDAGRLRCGTRQFAEAVRAEGIGLNPHYDYVVADWPWAKPYLADGFETPNARAARDSSFILYVNENYGDAEARDTVAAIVKAERYYRA
jgi:dTDP-4-amino-4,6-dideoxygalactose transaminase